MELASMLAGEPFSDHPASVCPVIGSLLREYNDSLDEQRRQDFYAYASKVVGSHSAFDVVQPPRFRGHSRTLPVFGEPPMRRTAPVARTNRRAGLKPAGAHRPGRSDRACAPDP